MSAQQLHFGQWLTVAQASASLKISERAVQKRCKTGTLDARRVTTERGQQWEINPASLGANEPQGAEQTNRRTVANEPGAPNKRTANEPILSVQDGCKRTDEPRTNEQGAEPTNPEPTNIGDRREVELLREQLDREREFSAILKAQLEAVTQSEAQTKAALREALRAMPKALMAGDTSTTNAAWAEAPEEAQIAGAAPMHQGSPKTRQKPANRRGAGLAMVRDGIRRILGQ